MCASRLFGVVLLVSGLSGCSASPARPGPAEGVKPSPETLRLRTLERLLVGSLPALADPDAAALAVQADHAFARADFGAARRLARAALGRVPAREGCEARGPLLYLAWKASVLGGGETEEAFDAFEAECGLEIGEAPGAPGARAFLGLLVHLEVARGSGWSRDSLPDEWLARRDRARIAAELRARSAAVGGPRQELITLLLDELEVSFRLPRGPCDLQTPAEIQAERARIRAGLVRLGRADLAPWLGLGPLVDEQGAPRLEALAAYLRALDAPEHLWLKSAQLGAVLGTLNALARMQPDPVLVRPICEELLRETERRMGQDVGEGALDRNTDLLTGLLTAAAGCPDRRPLQALVERMLARANQDERGRIAVLGLVANLGGGMLQALLAGQANRAIGEALELLSALEALLPGLGTSPDERALAGVIHFLTAITPYLRGDPQGSLGQLARAEAAFDELPFPPPAEAPRLVRLGPGLQLAAGIGLGLAQHLLGSPEAARLSLERQAGRLERAVPLLMQALDATAHVEQALPLAQAGLAMLRSGLGGEPDPARLRGLLSAARPRLPAEAGDAWDLGLLAGHVLLLDVAGLLGEGAARGELMALARAGLAEGVERGLAWFAPGDPDWDPLRLLPWTHQVLERMFAEEGQSEDVWGDLARVVLGLRPELEALMDELAPAHPRAGRLERLARQGGLPDLAMEALWTVREVGLDRLQAGEQAAVAAARARLAELDESLRGAERSDLRVMLALFAALTEIGLGHSEQATGWFRSARMTAADTELAEAIWILDSLGARLMLKVGQEADAGAATRALELLRSALRPAEEAHGCGRTHPTQALHLPEAVLLARLNRPAEARRALGRYLEAVERGFGGEGRARLLYKYRRGHTVVQVDISMELANHFLPTHQGGAFQLGLGFQSLPAERELLTFEGEDLGQRRWERILQAHLMLAGLALASGEVAEADGALRRTRQVLRRLEHGHLASLGAFDAGGLEVSRQASDGPLLFWVGVLAQARGHTEVGEELEAAARGRFVGAAEEACGQDGELPPHLAGQPVWRSLESVVRAWARSNPRLEVPSAELLEALQRAAASKGSPIPSWAPSLVSALSGLNRGDPQAALRALGQAPAAERARPPLRRVRLLAEGMAASRWPELAAFGRLSAELSRAGYGAEASWLAAFGASEHAQADLEAALEPVLAALAGGMDPVTKGEAYLGLARAALAQGVQPLGLRLLTEALDALSGSMPLQTELGYELAALQRGFQLGQLEATRERLRRRLPLFVGVYGWRSELVVRLEAAGAALDVLLGRTPGQAELGSLQERCRTESTDDPVTSDFLASLRAESARGGDPVPLARRYLDALLASEPN
jgi:hypothetical protein